MMRIAIVGNSGSGKSTLARRLAGQHGLAVLDLDTVAWEPGQIAVPRPPADAVADVLAFCRGHERWVVEGCYAGLVSAALASMPMLVFLEPGIDACLANGRARPWEPHKYASKDQQDEKLGFLLSWVRAYYQRDNDYSFMAHQALFDAYAGPKEKLVSLADTSTFRYPEACAMNDDTRSSQALLVLLDHERANLMAQFERVPVARRAVRASEGAWSAVEIVEHVARVEAGVVKMIAKGGEMPRTATAAEIASAQMTPERIAAVRGRDVKLSAPERVHPTGTLSRGMAIDHLAAARAGLRAAVDAADPAVLDGILFPHPFIGPLTLRAWVALVAHHDARHAEQLAEVADHLFAAN